jgi:hypothetical protein
MQLNYSPQKPTAPGWYWCKNESGTEAVVRIDKSEHGLMCRWLHPNTVGGYSAAEMLVKILQNDPKTLWCGPLNPPDDKPAPAGAFTEHPAVVWNAVMAEAAQCRRTWGMGFPVISLELLKPFWERATGPRPTRP